MYQSGFFMLTLHTYILPSVSLYTVSKRILFFIAGNMPLSIEQTWRGSLIGIFGKNGSSERRVGSKSTRQ
jgi:hypothetical protein